MLNTEVFDPDFYIFLRLSFLFYLGERLRRGDGEYSTCRRYKVC